MGRNLASVQKVISLTPIPGADKIELARVLGWDCVVKKGEFKEGELGVYFEIDSIVPNTEVFKFLEDRKFRVKTRRFRGQISQGLLLPISAFDFPCMVFEGSDVTDFIGVTKWEPEAESVQFMSPKKKSLWCKLVYTVPFLKIFRKKVGEGTGFPTHLVPKTDETRLQAFPPDFLKQYERMPVSITQKMDGSSVTFILNKNKFSVASRNVWMIEKQTNNFWKMAEDTNVAYAMKKLKKKYGNFAIQGEMCGPGVQGNKYRFDHLVFFLFGAYSIDKQEYFTPAELSGLYSDMKHFCTPQYFTMVDILSRDGLTIGDIGTTVEDWVKYATTRSIFTKSTWNEGIVIRSMDNRPYGVKNMNGKRFSFKVINPEFLLQYDL